MENIPDAILLNPKIMKEAGVLHCSLCGKFFKEEDNCCGFHEIYLLKNTRERTKINIDKIAPYIKVRNNNINTKTKGGAYGNNL